MTTTSVTPSSSPPVRSLALRTRTSSDLSTARHPIPLPLPIPVPVPQPITTTATTTTTTAGAPAPGPPPDYDSIRDPSASAAAQAARNREKQAVRDQQRAQEEHLAAVHRGEVAPSHGPRSVEPASSNSQSDPSSPRPRADRDNSGPSVRASVVSLGSAQHQPQSSGSGGAGDSVYDTRSILPPGMDVRDALARCEDPTLGWSLQFWVTIADPLTQHVFFACPANGQCSWDPPVGAFVVPRSPDGEWWELADTTRKNRSYYYNTLTGKTQWTRPGGDAFVIPLGLIQQNALPARPEASGSTSHTPSAPRTPHRNNRRSSNLPPGAASPPTNSPLRASIIASHPIAIPSHPEPVASSSRQSSSGTTFHSPTIGSALGGVPIAMHWPQAHPTGSPPKPPRQGSAPSPLGNGGVFPPTNGSSSYVPRAPLAAVDEGSGNETDRSDGSGWWGRRKSTAVGMIAAPLKGMKKPSRANMTRSDSDDTQPSTSNLSNGPIASRSTQDVSAPSPAGSVPVAQVPESTEPIFVESPVNLKRLSTGWHPVLKPDISTAIQAFQTNDFAHKYFATKRSGVLRSKVPLERIMEWQRAAITSPLLVLSRQRQKDALTTFKVIQHVMCERDKPVEGLKSTPSSSSSMNLAGLALGKKNGNLSPPPNGSNGGTDKSVVLEEIKWMVGLAVINGEMRDEVYCQLIKQLTKNPDPDSCVLGFQLFCVIVNGFGPSKNFETFVRGFLEQHVGQETNGIGIMAKYCLNKLDVLASQGGRGKTLTIGEIEHASDAAFYPSVYGESLDRIMEIQARSYPDSKVPVILPFLADGIITLGGTQCEGTFRIPGDGDSVAELKARMDRGHYQLQGIDDPHVAASLFKLWLRELEEPVVPSRLYNDALAASKSPQETVQFIHRLPTNHKRVLLFVVSFAQVFLKPEVVERTKMTASNLALVLAPNILRTTSQVLFTVFTNSSFESRFVHHLLTHLDCSVVDPEYIGYVPTQPL